MTPQLSFCLGATYSTLPSPSNLLRRHINPEASCLLCKKQVCTTVHVLGTCTVALQQGCFTFCHDSVLSVLLVALESFLSTKKCNNAPVIIPANFSKLVKIVKI